MPSVQKSPSTRFRSTRQSENDAKTIDFEEMLFAGLSPDGGLYVPCKLPKIDPVKLDSWRNFTFSELAYEIFSLFIDEELVASEALKDIVDKSFGEFDHEEITPLMKLDEHSYLLELYHGPTLAFKDIALQVLAWLLSHFLQRRSSAKPIIVLGATSGDTGSAAIEAMRSLTHSVQTVILYPKDRVSTIQKLQMTSTAYAYAKVHALEVEGTFDDCQAIVKQIFGDQKVRLHCDLVAINSINFARIMAQIVYYVYAAFKVSQDLPILFSIPTGNFGDALAGYYAKKMNVIPSTASFMIATNCNDILPRFFSEKGVYKPADGVIPTVTPAMDIQISSNFERYLYYATDCRGDLVRDWMEQLKTKGGFKVGNDVFERAQEDFNAKAISQRDTLQAIRNTYLNYGILVDPHTAVGVAAVPTSKSTEFAQNAVYLATAHPAKFPEAIHQALHANDDMAYQAQLKHPRVAGLFQLPTKSIPMKSDFLLVCDYLLGLE